MRQVEEALARQVIYGGDLVTNLLEVARVDEGVLTELLAASMGLSPAPASELPRAADSVLALVPADFAVQHLAVPLEVKGEELLLAVAEPVSDEVKEQLAFSLGMRIGERAAPAVRVWQAIARAYGTQLDRRMERLVARLSGDASAPVRSLAPLIDPANSTPPPPRARGTPPPPQAAASRPSSPPPAPIAGAGAMRHPPKRRATLTGLAAGRNPASMSAPAPAEVEASPSTRLLERSAGLLQQTTGQSQRPARRHRGPLTFEVARREVEEASDRDGLLALLFDFARQFFEYCALFLVQGDIAEGRDGFGSGASRERVRGIGVPLDLPSLLSNARESRALVVASAAPDGLDAELLADLQRPASVEIAVLPVVVRTRAVALLVGDCGDTGIDRDALRQIVDFCALVSRAFERIIVRRKLEGFVAGSRGSGQHRFDTSSLVPKHPAAMVAAASAPKHPSGALAAAPVPRHPSGALAAAPVPRHPSGALAAAPVPRHPSGALAAAVLGSPAASATLPVPRAVEAPPPAANIAASRKIAGPPIPREEPESLAEPGHGAASDTMPSPAPSSAPAPRPEARLKDSEEKGSAKESEGRDSNVVDGLSAGIVDEDAELAARVDRLIAGEGDAEDETELLRGGESAMRVLMARFPGPLTFELSNMAATASPPRPSECGPILRLIVRQGKPALPFVLQRISDPDPETRGWASYLLCELPYLEALPHLVPRLQDPDAGTRASAVRAVASVARAFGKPVVDALVRFGAAASASERAAAMRAMGEARQPAIVPDLIRELAEVDQEAKAAAHEALVRITLQDLGVEQPPWLEWWEHNSDRHRIEWLIDALTHENPDMRGAAAEELRVASRQYFGYAGDLPPRDRERAQQRYRDWWITEGRARHASR